MHRLLFPRIGTTVLSLVVLLLFTGCAPRGPGLVVDGWAIGDEVDCASDLECRAFVPAATIGFDRRSPGHAPIMSVNLYQHGKPGEPVLQVCSGGCPVVAVFRLFDGSIHAIGVGTPGIATEPMTFDYGPASPR